MDDKVAFRRLEALKQLQEHEGWKLIREYLDKEKTQAAQQIASPKPMSPDILHFCRGAYWATDNFTQLVEKLIAEYDNYVFMAKAAKSTDDGTSR